jgi:hypothetical protein
MAKKRGRYARGATVHVKSKGKKSPMLKLTLYLPEDVVHKIFPQIKRFIDASKSRSAKNNE